MKKKTILMLVLSGLLACMNIGQALGAGYGTAIVNGGNADRVHLRQSSSADSKSLGLYFTGTKVLCASDPKKEWVLVTVGMQSGYMKSEFLYRGSNPGSIKSKQPAAVVKINAGSWVNLREEPSLRGPVTGKCHNGDIVTVYGETADHWCYVKAGDLNGYVMSGYLTMDESGTPDAPGYGTAVIDGQNADRVHLRQLPSASSRSLGLYFTGTKVLCASDPKKEWVMVTIGSETGYMKSEFLYRGNNPGSVKSKQPAAVVTNKNTSNRVNLREKPSLTAAVVGRCYHGDAVTVLGQTATNWYYVKTGGLYGYMMSDFLSVGSSTPSSPSNGYQMLVYTAAPNKKSSIKIQYPKFTGSGLTPLNELIYAKVHSFAQDAYSAYSADIGLTIDYQSAVTLKNNKIVSMVFWGSSHVEAAAHPFSDLIAYNIDLSTMEEITFEDLYTTAGGFEQVFFKKAFFPTNPVTSYDASRFSEMLREQAEESKTANPFGYPGGVSCFLKPDGIVLSMGAVHASGSDHFEAQLPYGDIQKFYKLKQKYWEN